MNTSFDPPYEARQVSFGDTDEWGLFAKRDIQANEFIGFFTGDYVRSTDHIDDETSYALDCAPNMRIVPFADEDAITPEDRRRHPLALLNEPREDDVANVCLVVQDFRRSEVAIDTEYLNGSKVKFYRGIAAFACSKVPQNTELTWHYGPSYEPVRRRKNYVAGKACHAQIPDESRGVLDAVPQDKIPRDWVFPVFKRVNTQRATLFPKVTNKSRRRTIEKKILKDKHDKKTARRTQQQPGKTKARHHTAPTTDIDSDEFDLSDDQDADPDFAPYRGIWAK